MASRCSKRCAYPAPGGVVNTNAPLAAINVPVGTVQEPQATANMSMTANLDSTTAVGSPFPAEVTVYDSLGEPHTVTIRFTPTAVNVRRYAVQIGRAHA